jgi:hypothetical protein
MSQKPIPKIADFNADAVVSRVFINPRFEPVEAAAARFVLSTFVMNSDFPQGLSGRKAEVDNAVNFLQDRLYYLESYLENFFTDDHYDKDALLLAVLCGEHIHTANEEDGARLDLSFDPYSQDPEENALTRARLISGEAGMLAVASCEMDLEDISSEALFLAHIEALLHTLPSVQEALTNIEDEALYGDDLREFAEYGYKSIDIFADRDTDIGIYLSNLSGVAYGMALHRLQVVPIDELGQLPQNDNFVFG